MTDQQPEDNPKQSSEITPMPIQTSATAPLPPIPEQVKPEVNNNDDNDNKGSVVGTSTEPPLYLLYCIIILQLLIFLSEMIIDQMVHSMLVLADAYHHLFNAFNAILLVVCFKISNQITVTNTFGWVRTEVLGMLTTITFIVALIFSLLIEGFLQLFHLHEISGPTSPRVLAILGGWSFVVNVMYVLVVNGVVTGHRKYRQTTREDRSFTTDQCERVDVQRLPATGPGPNVQSEPPERDSCRRISLPPLFELKNSHLSPPETRSDSSPGFLHSLTQGILSPVFLLFCSLLITLFDGSDLVEMIDPSVGITTAISLCITFYPQLKNTFLILMQTVPQNINIIQLKKEILDRFQIIQNIHEFHIWLLTGSNIVATCHIVLPPCQTTGQYWRLFEEIREFLQNKYGIQYVTIQPEFQPNDDYQQHPNPAKRRHSSCPKQCLIRCPAPSATPNGGIEDPQPCCAGRAAVCQTKTCCPDDGPIPEIESTRIQSTISTTSV